MSQRHIFNKQINDHNYNNYYDNSTSNYDHSYYNHELTNRTREQNPLSGNFVQPECAFTEYNQNQPYPYEVNLPQGHYPDHLQGHQPYSNPENTQQIHFRNNSQHPVMEYPFPHSFTETYNYTDKQSEEELSTPQGPSCNKRNYSHFEGQFAPTKRAKNSQQMQVQNESHERRIVEDTRHELSRLKEEFEALKVILQGNLYAAEQNVSAMEEIQLKMNTHALENSKLQMCLQHVKQMNATQQTQIKQLQTLNTGLKKKNIIQQTQIKQLQTQHAELQKENAALQQTQIRQLEMQNTETYVKLNKATTSLVNQRDHLFKHPQSSNPIYVEQKKGLSTSKPSVVEPLPPLPNHGLFRVQETPKNQSRQIDLTRDDYSENSTSEDSEEEKKHFSKTIKNNH